MPTTTETPPPAHARAPFDPIAWLRREWVTALGFLVGLAVMAHYTYFVLEAEAGQRCQRTYNQAFAGQLLARADTADKAAAVESHADATTDRLISGFGAMIANPYSSSPGDQMARAELTRKLFADYAVARRDVQQARAAVKAARAAHPLPQIPAC